MVRRALSFLWILLLPLQAAALGLGDIQVDSALNEPLDARIELHSLDPREVQDIRVLLADKEAFKKAGLERPYLLNSLRFKVGMDARGEGFIRVSTRANVKEPYLNFLLEVTWRGGVLQREYVVLLDPPTYRVEQVPVQSGEDTVPAKGTTSVSRQLPELYRVRPAETLWVIAEKVRPKQIHTVEQVMMALQRRNPEAFLDNNVNRLKSGAILEVPDSVEVERMGSAAAAKEFKRQTQAWKDKRAQSMQPVAPVVQQQKTDESPSDQQAQAEPEPSAATPGEPEEEQAQLRILEPVDRETIEEALTSTEGGPDQQMARLRSAIEASKQELESVREINRELDQLRSTLETEIGALRQSLEERDAVIQELVKRMEQEDAAAAALAKARANIEADSLTAAPAVTEEADPGAIESSLAGTDSLTQDTADDEGSSVWVTGLLTVVILVMALVAFFLWWSLYRGRSSKDESVLYSRVDLPEVAITKESYDGLYRKLEQQEIEERERLEAEMNSQSPADQTDVLLTDEFFDEFEEQSSDSVETQEVSTETKLDVGAIMTEADVYLIYRQYAKAESLVQECLQSHPQEPRLMAKLLEIYASQKAKAQFVAYLDEVADPLQKAAPDIWQRVEDLGSTLVPEHPLFNLGGSALVEDDELDSGLTLQDSEAAGLDIPAFDEELQDSDSAGASDSLDLELDLDDDDRGPGR